MGNTGATGATGKGVKSAATTYQAAASGTTIPTGTWSTSVPKTTAALPYLWSRTITTYTDNSTSTAYAVGSTPEGIVVGGRNRFIGSSKYRIDNPFIFNAVTSNDAIKYFDDIYTNEIEKNTEYILQVKSDGNLAKTHGYNTDTKGKFTIWMKYIKKDDNSVQHTNFNSSQISANNNPKYLGSQNGTFYWLWKTPDYEVKDNNFTLRANTYASTDNPVTMSFWDFKFEKGNKPTDWSPAPEDINNELDKKASNESLENERKKLQEALNKANQRIDSINAVIQSLTSSGANESVLTQTPEGWKFNMTKFNNAINANQEAIAKETTDRQTGDSNNAALINKVNGYVTKIENGQEISYVNIGTDADNNPCVLLGKNGGTDNQFRVSISNKEIQFLKDSGNGNYTKIAYIDGSTFYGDNITAVKRLQVGIAPNNYYWEVRSNGNLGLNYKTN